MLKISEKDFEKELINSLQKYHNFEYKTEIEILKLRGSDSEVLLIDVLKEAIKKNNHQISEYILDKVIFEIKQTRQSSLEIANKHLHELITNGVRVFNEKKRMTETIQIINFEEPEKNKFIVTNQFKLRTETFNSDSS